MRSTDVLHDFTVPQFRVKMDLVPGLVTYQWFTPTVPGTYEILCEELCGTGHFAMRGKIVVDEPAAYQAWLANAADVRANAGASGRQRDRRAANYAVCSACHGPQGEGNQQLNAPKLAGRTDWYVRRQLLQLSDGHAGHGDPGDSSVPQMAPMSQTRGGSRDAGKRDRVHRDAPRQSRADHATIGDVEHGRELYETCTACHGEKGKGRWGTNAPRLAGMTDWYFERQLRTSRREFAAVIPRTSTATR